MVLGGLVLKSGRRYLYAMLLRPEYLSQELDRPLPTKDGGSRRYERSAPAGSTAIHESIYSPPLKEIFTASEERLLDLVIACSGLP